MAYVPGKQCNWLNAMGYLWLRQCCWKKIKRQKYLRYIQRIMYSCYFLHILFLCPCFWRILLLSLSLLQCYMHQHSVIENSLPLCSSTYCHLFASHSLKGICWYKMKITTVWTVLIWKVLKFPYAKMIIILNKNSLNLSATLFSETSYFEGMVIISLVIWVDHVHHCQTPHLGLAPIIHRHS